MIIEGTLVCLTIEIQKQYLVVCFFFMICVNSHFIFFIGWKLKYYQWFDFIWKHNILKLYVNSRFFGAIQYNKQTTSVLKKAIFILMDRFKLLSYLFSLLNSKPFENRKRIYKYKKNEEEKKRERKKGK